MIFSSHNRKCYIKIIDVELFGTLVSFAKSLEGLRNDKIDFAFKHINHLTGNEKKTVEDTLKAALKRPCRVNWTSTI